MTGTTHRDWYADAEAALLDLLTECDKAVIIGLSKGGLVALEPAARHNDKTAAVVTIAPALRFADPLVHFSPMLAKLFKSWPSPSSYSSAPSYKVRKWIRPCMMASPSGWDGCRVAPRYQP